MTESQFEIPCLSESATARGFSVVLDNSLIDIPVILQMIKKDALACVQKLLFYSCAKQFDYATEHIQLVKYYEKIILCTLHSPLNMQLNLRQLYREAEALRSCIDPKETCQSKETQGNGKCHLPTQSEIAERCGFLLSFKKRSKDEKGSKDSQLGMYFTKKYSKIIKTRDEASTSLLKTLGDIRELTECLFGQDTMQQPKLHSSDRPPLKIYVTVKPDLNKTLI